MPLSMSSAAGGAAPTQPAGSAAVVAPPPAITAQEPDRAARPPSLGNPRDPAPLLEGADPGNAATRKKAWNVPPLPPPAATAPGGIMGGEDLWPALAESTRAWPKSASSDSLKSLFDGSTPSVLEELIVPSLPSESVSNPIPAGPNTTSTFPPPPNAIAVASSRQNSGTNRSLNVEHGGDNGGSDGGGSCGNESTANTSSTDENNGSGADANWNNRVLGDSNSRNGGGGSNLNSTGHISGISGSAIDNIRRTNTIWIGNGGGGGGGGGGSNNIGTGSGDGINRNGGGSGNPWNYNARNGSGSNNGFGGRGGRNRRDHERGGSFSPRNYPRMSPLPHQQQQSGIYQPGPFHRPPPPPPPAHFMVPQPFGSYVPPFVYPADAQAYPFYITPVEQQFQNMHLVQQPMQPLWVHQDQLSLQEDIRQQIEFYFSTNNLCHDTYLRRHMNEQGWVPIDLLAGFPMLRRFTNFGVDTNYILDAIRVSDLLEVQGNNVRRRNDWAEWLLH